MAPVHASAITPDNNLTAIRVCSQGGNNLCMNGFNGPGGVIKGFADNGITPDPKQDVNVDQVSNCGGVVTANATDGFCPFSNHTLDTQLKGKQVVSIFNSANGMVYRWDGGGGVVESTTGDGQVWVKDGDLTGASPGALLVNVEATNDNDGIETFVCTNGPGAPLQATDEFGDPNNIPSRCFWQGETG
jgi:hypothetical protein